MWCIICIMYAGNSMWAAVRFCIWHTLWCLVSWHHRHWTGRWVCTPFEPSSHESTFWNPKVNPIWILQLSSILHLWSNLLNSFSVYTGGSNILSFCQNILLNYFTYKRHFLDKWSFCYTSWLKALWHLTMSMQYFSF